MGEGWPYDSQKDDKQMILLWVEKNLTKLIIYAVIAACVAGGLYWVKSLVEDNARLELAQEFSNKQTIKANKNTEVLKNEIESLNARNRAEQHRREEAQRVAAARQKELRDLLSDLGGSGVGDALNLRVRKAFERAGGRQLGGQEGMPEAGSTGIGAGPWFCYDQRNAEPLITGIEKMSDYIFTNEGYHSSDPPT